LGAIQLLWKWDEESVMRLTRVALRTGRHPAVLLPVSCPVSPKLGKDNYTKLTAFRSISLLSCIGRVVHTVFTEPLPDEAEKRGLLSDRQFGRRKGR